MGGTQSLPFRTFEFGDYWIGKPLASVKRGLAFHFPTRMIKSVSSSELLKLSENPPEGDDIVVIYDPADGKAQHIITGLEF
jgi:hypothetical protein